MKPLFKTLILVPFSLSAYALETRATGATVPNSTAQNSITQNSITQYTNPEFEKNLARIELLESSQYFPFMLTVVQALSTGDFGAGHIKRQHELARKYARLALKRMDEMPVQTQMQFLRPLTIPTEGTSETHLQHFGLLVRFLANVEKKIDKDYVMDAPENRGYMNIAPKPKQPLPLSQITISGMRPQDVKDPETRAAYELALAENQRKVKKRLEQIEWKAANEEFSSTVARYLAWLCTKSDVTQESLDELLKQSELSSERKAALQKVMENHAKNQKPEAPAQEVIPNE